MAIRDLTKEGKLGRLTAIERLPKYRGNNCYYKCVCDCGNIVFVYYSNLTRGITKSCGCLRKENTSCLFKKHGFSKEKLYLVWKAIKKRCYQKNDKSYEFYGKLGVTVCDEWKNNYMSFRKWAYDNGYKDTCEYTDYTIDRINPYGNYEPSNCRIANWTTQRHNRRSDYDKKLE